MMDLGEISKSVNRDVEVADFSIANANGPIIATQNTEVRLPPEYLEDNLVAIRESDLEKARSILEAEVTRKESIPKGEIFLAIATTLLGVFLTSLFSGVAIQSSQGIFSFCVSPALTVGFFIAYLWARKEKEADARHFATRALDHLANPRQPESSNNEHQRH